MGFMHDDVIDVRKRIPERAGITYTIIATTHNHQAPDMVGLWGGTQFTGEDYKEPLFSKAEAQGEQLALAALRSMGHIVS